MLVRIPLVRISSLTRQLVYKLLLRDTQRKKDQERGNQMTITVAQGRLTANNDLFLLREKSQLFHNTGGTSELNAAFEKADRLLEQRRTSGQFH
jgi:hypothetical protein